MAYDGGYGGPAGQYPPRPPPQRQYAPVPQGRPPPQQYDGYQDNFDRGGSAGGGRGAYNDYDQGYAQDDMGYGRGPPQGNYPPQPDPYGPPGPGRGRPPPGRGGPMQRPPPNGPYPPRGGPQLGQGRGGFAGPGRGGRPGPPERSASSDPGRPSHDPLSPGEPGFGGSAFPAFPGQSRRTDLDQEQIIQNQMNNLDISGRRPVPPPNGPGRGPIPPPNGYGPRQPPPRQYPPQQGYPQDFRQGPGSDPGYGPSSDPRDDGFGPPGRSMTMPNREPMGNFGNGFPPRSDSAPYSGPIGRGVPPRPSTAQGMHGGGQLPRGYPANGAGPGPYAEPEAQRPVSINDFYDSYYDQAASNPYPSNDQVTRSFDNIPGRARGDSLDQHMRPATSQEQAQRGPGRVPEMNRMKSQPDLRQPQAAVFEMTGDMPPVPSQYQQQGSFQNGPPANTGPLRQGGPSPTNPDALPSHPVPVRPGLMKDSLVNLGNKPPPVRNYSVGGPVPAPLAGPPQRQQQQPLPLQNGPPASPEPEPPVTVDELERLRAQVKVDPLDQATALRFAKRLVEAADTLVPMLPDPKGRARARERYVMDAQKILKKLTSANNPDAMFFYADCLGRGTFGNEPDQKEAFVLYQSAAKLGNAAAAYRTAVCCEIGNEEGGGTRKDPLKAIQWYKRAASLGDTPAMYKMGIILLKGLLGQPKNPREAVGWLKRAAERADVDNPHALHELGLLYESAQPNDAILRDEAYAFSLFKQAAELGYKFSQFRLGAAFEYGLMGNVIDGRQSIYWYSKAAVQEEHQSELALSGWYLTGSEGVLAQSDTEAYLWARKAALAGLAKAEYAMGYFTEVGIGVPANLEDAKRWYWRASAQDFPQARERLEDLKRNGRGGPRARERISRSKIGKQQEGECTVM